MSASLTTKKKLYQAQIMLDEEDFNGAIKILEQLKQDATEIGQIQDLLGEAYMSNNNAGKAIKLFGELIAADPHNPRYLGNLAQSYLIRGWHNKAIKPFKQAIALDEDNTWLWLGLCDAYLAGENFIEAKKLLHTALSRDQMDYNFTFAMYMQLFIIELMILNKRRFYDEGPMKDRLKHLCALAATMPGQKDELAKSLYGIARHVAKGYNFQVTQEILAAALDLSPDNEVIKQFKDKIDGYQRVEEEYVNLQLDEEYEENFIAFIVSKLIPFSDPGDDIYISLMEYGFLKEFHLYKDNIVMLEKEYPNIYQELKRYFKQMANIHQRNKKITQMEQFFNKNQEQLEAILLEELLALDLDEESYFDGASDEWDDE